MLATIYMICLVDRDGNEHKYIGSTKNLKARKYKHKSDMIYQPNRLLYQKLNESDTPLHLIPLDQCLIDGQRQREQFFINLLNPTLNCNNAYVSEAEKKQNNCRVQTKHYNKYKEEILAYKKTKIKCECNRYVARRNISTHRNSNIHKSIMLSACHNLNT
tara:strand:- start:115 stop:594 length:480 start_codon:yes stop_codon:yes gene_type:complete